MSDATKYLSTISNTPSTILQSTKKKLLKKNLKKVLDSLIFWGALHFINQNKNPALNLKLQYLTIGVHFSELISYHR